MPVPHFLQNPPTMYQIAEQYWDLKAYPTQYVFSLLALISNDKLERDKSIELSSPKGQEDWLNYCRRPRRTVLEAEKSLQVLHDFHKSASKLTIEILFELFSTIKPRSFSIASGCTSSRGRELQLLVAVVKYKTKLKQPRLGLASNWLKAMRTGEKVYGWIKKGSLKFPDASLPHIMVGPGTGLAPFRSFLQTTDSNVHLFFGCRHEDKDFHCKEELMSLVEEGRLKLYCAFSRDQEDKVYVQHKIKEQSKLLWDLIHNQNAYIFISGNAKNMPDNVRDAFVEVFQNGGLNLEDARSYLKKMESDGRLQVETW